MSLDFCPSPRLAVGCWLLAHAVLQRICRSRRGEVLSRSATARPVSWQSANPRHKAICQFVTRLHGCTFKQGYQKSVDSSLPKLPFYSIKRGCKSASTCLQFASSHTAPPTSKRWHHTYLYASTLRLPHKPLPTTNMSRNSYNGTICIRPDRGLRRDNTQQPDNHTVSQLSISKHDFTNCANRLSSKHLRIPCLK